MAFVVIPPNGTSNPSRRFRVVELFDFLAFCLDRTYTYLSFDTLSEAECVRYALECEAVANAYHYRRY